MGHEGPVFGSNDNWNGLGIFLDSFDNDAQVTIVNNFAQILINLLNFNFKSKTIHIF